MEASSTSITSTPRRPSRITLVSAGSNVSRNSTPVASPTSRARRGSASNSTPHITDQNNENATRRTSLRSPHRRQSSTASAGEEGADYVEVYGDTPSRRQLQNITGSPDGSRLATLGLLTASPESETVPLPPALTAPHMSNVEQSGDGYAYPGDGTEENPYVVSFQTGDPVNPKNWHWVYRWFLMFLGACCMTGPLISIAIITSGYSGMMKTSGANTEDVTASGTLYLFGLAIGSLMWAPLGELYGRKPVMMGTLFLYSIFTLGLSFSNTLAQMLVLRFFAGIFGSAPMSHAPAMGSDLFYSSEIAMPLIFVSIARFFGPSVAPIFGGWIFERTGNWRWCAWVAAILGFCLTLIATLLMPETYPPVLLKRKAKQLANTLNGQKHITAYQLGRKLSVQEEVYGYLVRPFLFLFVEPIVLLLSLHVAFLYGILNLFFSAYPYIFKTERHWSQGDAGFSFFGIIVGFALAVPLAVWTNQPYLRKSAKSPDGRAPPEERLWFGMLGAILLPISLFWLGWSSTGVHWIVPVLSGIPFGIGQVALTLSVFCYFSDVYVHLVGSVLAGSNFMRFMFGGVFPLFSTQMFQKLGSPWACSLLGFLCIVFAPAPIGFYIYGQRIRTLSRYVPEVPSFAVGDATIKSRAVEGDLESGVLGGSVTQESSPAAAVLEKLPQ